MGNPVEVGVQIDGSIHAAHSGERLVDLINRIGLKLAQVCYHPQLGPIGTTRIRAFCATADRVSESPVASPAATASRCVRAMRLWKSQCSGTPTSVYAKNRQTVNTRAAR
jgi:hypothetical protein